MKRTLATIVASCFLSLPLYAQDSESKDLLPGEEGYPVKQVEPLNISRTNSDNAFFVGGGLGFGQARSTEPGSSAGLTTLGSLEIGYQMSRGRWNRFEGSLQVLTGRASFRTNEDIGGKTDIPIKLGVLARLGYGYSIGERFFGMFRLGVGSVMAGFEASPDGVDIESDGTLAGLAGQLGWIAVMPMADAFDLTGGFTWTHLQLDVDKVKVGGNTQDYDRAVLVNLPQIELGMRLRI